MVIYNKNEEHWCGCLLPVAIWATDVLIICWDCKKVVKEYF